MENIQREKLSAYLSVRARDTGAIPLAMRHLEPFFNKVESGTYDLANRSEICTADVLDALVTATGLDVRKVEVISDSDRPMGPIMPPAMMMRKREVRGIATRATIEDYLWASYGSSFKDGLRASTRRTLRRCIGMYFGRRLWWCIKEALSEDIFCGSLPQSIILDSLLIYLGLVLADDKEEVARILPLIDILPRSIPLGEKKDEPGTWLVLCA